MNFRNMQLPTPRLCLRILGVLSSFRSSCIVNVVFRAVLLRSESLSGCFAWWWIRHGYSIPTEFTQIFVEGSSTVLIRHLWGIFARNDINWALPFKESRRNPNVHEFAGLGFLWIFWRLLSHWFVKSEWNGAYLGWLLFKSSIGHL